MGHLHNPQGLQLPPTWKLDSSGVWCGENMTGWESLQRVNPLQPPRISAGRGGGPGLLKPCLCREGVGTLTPSCWPSHGSSVVKLLPELTRPHCKGGSFLPLGTHQEAAAASLLLHSLRNLPKFQPSFILGYFPPSPFILASIYSVYSSFLTGFTFFPLLVYL